MWGMKTQGVFLESLAMDFTQEAVNLWTIIC